MFISASVDGAAAGASVQQVSTGRRRVMYPSTLVICTAAAVPPTSHRPVAVLAAAIAAISVSPWNNATAAIPLRYRYTREWGMWSSPPCCTRSPAHNRENAKMIVHRQPTGRQIVEGNDFVAEAQQVICEMTADESCPTGHEISHRVCCCNGSDPAESHPYGVSKRQSTCWETFNANRRTVTSVKPHSREPRALPRLKHEDGPEPVVMIRTSRQVCRPRRADWRRP